MKPRIVHGGTEEHTEVQSLDRKGPGGAYHEYEITPHPDDDETLFASITFQKGPIQQNGVNGCTNEDLLAVVKDRLECFQKGKFACVWNKQALRHIVVALACLHNRTADRKKRGVEGKNVK